MTAQQKEWIDNATYERLLRKWRFAPIGDPYFVDQDTSDYYCQRMRDLREAPGGEDEHIRASRAIGWGPL
jgi:hypothetical protein